MGGLCVSPDHGRRLASHCASSSSGRKCQNGGLCHPLNLSSQPHRNVAGRAERHTLSERSGDHGLGSLDTVDGTPVIDIKPYLPFAEALPDARASYAQDAPQADMPVHFTSEITTQISELEKRYPRLRDFIVEVLAQDPVPPTAKKRKPGKRTPSGCWTLTCAGA